MSEKKVQGMGLEGGEGELATVAIYPRAADGVSCWGASGRCGGGSDSQQRRCKRWQSCMRNA